MIISVMSSSKISFDKYTLPTSKDYNIVIHKIIQGLENEKTAIYELINQQHQFNLDFHMIRPCFKKYDALYILKSKTDIIGYAIIVRKQPHDEIWIEFMDIKKRHQKCGYGSYIISIILQDYKLFQFKDKSSIYYKNIYVHSHSHIVMQRDSI